MSRGVLEDVGEAHLAASLPRAAVIGIRREEREERGGFAEDHLFVDGVDLAP